MTDESPNKNHNLALDAETITAFADIEVSKFRDPLAKRGEELVAAADQWNQVDVTDENEKAAVDYRDNITAFEKDVEEGHKKGKKPFWDAGKAFDGAKKDLLALVPASKKMIAGKIQVLLDERQREIDRKTREAEEKAREAEEASCAAEEAAKQDGPAGVSAEIAADKAREDADALKAKAEKVSKAKPVARGSTGRARGLVEDIKFKILNADRLLRSVKDDPAIWDAVAAVTKRRLRENRAAEKQGREPPHVLLGIEVESGKKIR